MLISCSICLHVSVSERLNPDPSQWSVLSEEGCWVAELGELPNVSPAGCTWLCHGPWWVSGSEPAWLALHITHCHPDPCAVLFLICFIDASPPAWTPVMCHGSWQWGNHPSVIPSYQEYPTNERKFRQGE